MLGYIKNKAAQLKLNLFSLNEQPIGKAALSVIIFLDIFILISIFNGLDEHTGQLSSPYEFIPQSCRIIVINNDWNETNRLTRLARAISNSRNYYYLRNEKDRHQERHPTCTQISKLFLSIEDDRSLTANLKEFLDTKNEVKDLNSELDRIKGAYNTSLLEIIADKGVKTKNVSALKKEMTEKTTSLNKLLRKQKVLES